jgi:hypothetical protein
VFVLTQLGVDELVQATQLPFWQKGVDPVQVLVAQLVPEQNWRVLLLMQVGLEALVQATQAPREQTGDEPVQAALTQLPTLQCRLVVASEHSVAVPVQATHWPATQ